MTIIIITMHFCVRFIKTLLCEDFSNIHEWDKRKASVGSTHDPGVTKSCEN